MKFLSVVFILLLSSFAFSQSKNDEALKSLINQMTDAQINYQPEILDKIFTSDFIEISPIGEFDPREKVLGFYRPENKPPADKMSVKVEANDFSIRNYGKFAVVIAKFDYTMTNNGNPVPPQSLRGTFVCRKEKGVWKIASAQYTGIRPPQQQPTK